MRNQKALIIAVALLLALLCIGSVSADVRLPHKPSEWESKGRILELRTMINENTDRIQTINRELVSGRLTSEEKVYLLEERNLLVEQNFKHKQEMQRLSRQRN